MKKLALLGATLSLLLVAGCQTQQRATEIPAPAPAPKNEPTAYIVDISDSQIETAKNAVLDQLIDPESARFYRIYGTLTSAPNKEPRVCGEVNAKNRMGGYTGRKRFVVASGKPYIWEDKSSTSFSNFMIQAQCDLRPGETVPD